MTALFNMPFANVSAILQAMPLDDHAGGRDLSGRAVGWRRLVAIVVGFGGVLLIVRPGGEGFTIYSVYVLAAVLAVTLRDLVTRRLSAAVPSMSVALVAAIGRRTCFGPRLDLRGMGSRFQALRRCNSGGRGLFVMLGYLFSVMVMRVGDIGFRRALPLYQSFWWR
jgi:S-adenosylmethionine uptake transporter